MHLLYLDTMVFISAIEGTENDSLAQCARAVIRSAVNGTVRAVTSELTIAEVLSFRAKELSGSERSLLRAIYEEVLINQRAIALCPVSREHMFISADLSATQSAKVRLPDRLHLAAAIDSGATHFVSLDQRINPPAPIQKIGLDEATYALLQTQVPDA